MTRFDREAVKVCAGTSLLMSVCLPIWWASPGDVIGAGPSPRVTASRRGDTEAGRQVFNGKGVCYYCHGVDGHRNKPPQLEAETAALIARLDPPPADLRNPKSLRLVSDKARFRAIREGHPGTGMFPDTALTDQEVTDVLAYLALLRREGVTRR